MIISRKLFLILLCMLFAGAVLCPRLYAEDVQGAAVAGYFYPKDRQTLKNMVDGFIKNATPESVEGDIVAVISPHAGYEYSGAVAGYTFKAVKDKPFKTVVIVAPSHHYSFDGLSILDRDSYLTPLGKVAVDKELTKEFLAADKLIKYYMQPFLKEHAAEVEIPFIYQALPQAKIVVILTGRQSYDNCVLLRDALTKVLKGRKDILIVVSTDMSHYHPQMQACLMDKDTLKTIEDFDAETLFSKISVGENELCGAAGVVGVLMASRNLGADSIKVLKYATSGDVTGDNSAVVGYGSVAVYKSSAASRQPLAEKKQEKKMEGLLTEKQKKRLLEIARTTLDTYITNGKISEFKEADPALNEEMGAFVTLHKHGELRGCIGNMIGRGPLYLTIRDMAIASSTEDPRFGPVRKEELKDIDIEISVLSPMEKISDPEKIIMGKHGVMVQRGFRSGVYLPQVATETGWSRDEFMNSLCAHKAGMPQDSWKTGNCDIYIFTAEVFGEK